MTKLIFITGGVASSLGKGLTAASLATLLQAHGFSVRIRKLDPYLNIDSGTISPLEHGEVFVTKDGLETDLDLGHYERFTDVDSSRRDNITAGRIYAKLLANERKGDYLGKTIQIIPHFTNLIKEFILDDINDLDFLLCEIGGTVGDIEGLPFYETIREISYNMGQDQVLFIHLTFLPYIKAAGEIKTKPTQHSVKTLLSIGIQPNILICRSEHPVSEKDIYKIASFCNIKKENVVLSLDVSNIYEAPLYYHAQKLDSIVLKYFNVEPKNIDLGKWDDIQTKLESRSSVTRIAVIGKYMKLLDAYKSVHEALIHAGISLLTKIEIIWVDSKDLNQSNAHEILDEIQGILVPGGFGEAGTEGKITAINFARENNIPFFGICLGMQLAVIALSRSAGINKASSTEFNPDCENPVITIINKDESNLGGTMRLGSYQTHITRGSLAYDIYNSETIDERHRHRYEFNIDYQKILEENNVIFSGISDNGKLIDIIELKDHKFFIAVQFHPEFKSRPFMPHPLFYSFIKASMG